MNNRMWNIKNPHQGKRKKVLCVCSAGLLRSPTVAWILSNDPFGFNTRAAGIDADHALIPVDEALLGWADEIVFVERSVADRALSMFDLTGMIFNVLDLPDQFAFRDPELVAIATEQLKEAFNE